MSAVFRGTPLIYHSCLRLLRTPRRFPTPLARPIRTQFLCSTRRLHSTLTEQTADDNLASVQSNPSSKLPFKIAPTDITLFGEYLNSGRVTSAYEHFIALASQFPESDGKVKPEDPLGHLALDGILQPILGQILEAIIIDDGRNPNLPKPLELLEQMRKVGVLQNPYYSTLLIWMLKNGANTGDLVPAFESAISFNSDHLVEVMSEVDEFVSLDLDIATPYFATFLILRDKGMESESLLSMESVLKRFPYPTFRHVERVLDHHNFSIDLTAKILSLLRAFSAETLFTNRYTLRQLINAELATSATHENLDELYKSVRKAATNPLAPHIYSTFVGAYMSLAGSRSSPLASQTAAFSVWNDMINDGLSPSVIEWTHLLKSFANQQDKSAIIPLWNKMLRAGVVPDHHCWTVRIHAHLEADSVKEGLDSLREMQGSGVPPTVGTINATIDGLLKFKHFTEAAQVLTTAERLGIPKDITTYNTLLVSLMKELRSSSKKFDEALALIRQMAVDGIAPDVKTITIILDGMYKFSNPKPQLSAVLSLIEYCESAGITINAWTYTALIRALLEQGREDAAIDILLIMESRGITGTRATYTVLLKYYFKRRDLGSIDQLLAEMSQRRVTMDGRTWREIAVGFAAAGEVYRMKEAITGMHNSPSTMGLLGFISILKALGSKGLLADAKDVIVDMLEKELIGRTKDVRMIGPEKEFWDVVEGLGKGIVLGELMKTGKVDDD